MRKMHNPLRTKVLSCFLAYLIVITPSVGANLAFAPRQTHRFAPTNNQQQTTSNKQIDSAYMKMPMPFVKNEGQMDEKVKLYGRDHPYE